MMMCSDYRSNRLKVLLVVVIVVVFGATTIHSVSSVGGAVSDCHQSERLALLRFKHDLVDPSDRLSSWVPDGSCCNWHGVVCDNSTGHVLELHLQGLVQEEVSYSDYYDYYYHNYEEEETYSIQTFGGKISNSLLDLKYLRHLDLNNNDFGGIRIPLFIGYMRSLTYLNLSAAGFGGEVPSHLGNLSNLLSLGLGNDEYSIHTKNLRWLSGLSMLVHLDLTAVTFPESKTDALQGINSLPLLEELHLSGCGLDHIPQLSYPNLSNLVTFDLSFNVFDSFPAGLENLTSLKCLDFSYCQIYSRLPKWLYKFSQLEQLSLQNNGFRGMITDDIANLTNLNLLDMSYNELEGKMPSSLRTMCKLEWLDLSRLRIAGKVSEVLRSLSGCASSRLRYISFSRCHLDGPLSFEVGKFQNLEQLDLSGNAISGQIPDSLGSLNSLKELNLYDNQLNGTLPRTLGKLHHLEQLDLSSNSISGTIPDSLGSLTALLGMILDSNKFSVTLPQTLGQLHHLRYLSLSYNSFSGPVPDSFGSLYSLTRLDMQYNQLSGTLPNTIGRLHHLRYLLLRGNSISGPIPDSLGSLSSLFKMDLSNNQLNGTLPRTIGRLHDLYFLNLHNNSISGAIPDSVGSLTSLEHLDLSRNKISGTLPTSLGQLIQLDTLEVSFNSLDGLLSSVFFANLTGLTVLGASGNRIRMNISEDWILPPQLQEVHLSSLYLGPGFPKWLSSRGNLLVLDISDAGINDVVPSWFWNTVSGISFLNLSHNHLHGKIIPGLSTWNSAATFDLSSNSFTGPLPQLSSNVITLDLSNNSFSGPMSSFLCDVKNEVKSLQVLHLGNNKLFGEVPDCWTSWPSLLSIELQDNNLSGRLPKSLGSLSNLQYLHFRNNSLSGVLPSSLRNCTKLVFFDIGENQLGGRIPKWIGQRFSNIRILSLRSNNFDGYAPNELCSLSLLIILDLANNNLSGAIPNCLANFRAMSKLSIPDFTTPNFVNSSLPSSSSAYEENAILVTKALVREYTKILRLMTAIDLSNNSLSGPIPMGITKLVVLKSLNLSGNSLTKKIPDNMGNMLALESLDLSSNRLSGEMPQSMASMTFLSVLNLSFNNLTGMIPTSTQLQSFNASSYVGNELCGPPVSAKCGPDGSAPGEQQGDNEDNHGLEYDEFFVSMSVGFVVGLGAVVAPLLYSPWWRFQYFQWAQSVWDRMWCGLSFCSALRFADVAWTLDEGLQFGCCNFSMLVYSSRSGGAAISRAALRIASRPLCCFYS